MTITYIYHSCYLLEFDDFSVIFDFYKDAKRDDGRFWVKDYLLEKKGSLYVFCTHSHSDHFNPEILEWQKQKADIKYIFSSEVRENKSFNEGVSVIYLNKLQTYEDEYLRVKAYGSTDAGASFLINVDGKRFFHAGDLNNWHWNEEVPKQEAATYENNYLCQLELVAEGIEEIFVLMFPVDPRLGKDYMLGAQQFISRIPVANFLPMHFGDHYDRANAFADMAAQYDCRMLRIEKKGQSFEL